MGCVSDNDDDDDDDEKRSNTTSSWAPYMCFHQRQHDGSVIRLTVFPTHSRIHCCSAASVSRAPYPHIVHTREESPEFRSNLGDNPMPSQPGDPLDRYPGR
jgi:hypothetical protein